MPMELDAKKKILAKLKKILKSYCPPMVVSKDGEEGIELIGNKAMPYGSKKQIVPGMFFVAVMVRKDMVSFHFFPIYYNEKTFAPLAPNMMKCLKGKTCFNIKKEEQIDEKEINALLTKGVEVWKKNGYMK